MKKIVSIIMVVILCAAALAGCMTSPSRVSEVRGLRDRYEHGVYRCEDQHDHVSRCIKDIEAKAYSSYYVICIKYYDGHIESIKAPVNSTYIYYAHAEDK